MARYRARGRRLAECGYYLDDKARSITCAGWCRDLVQELRFETAEDKDDWLLTHCTRRESCATCPRAVQLNGMLGRR